MLKMKTLTVGNKTYQLWDPEAARVEDSAVGETVWSSRKLVETFCPERTTQGQVAACQPLPDSSLVVLSHILPRQTGDPVPQNPCPITGRTQVNLTRYGKNLADITRLLVNAWAVDEEGAYYGSPVRLYDKYHLSRGSFLSGCFNRQTQYTVCMEAKQTSNDTASLIACFGYTDGTTSTVQIKGTEYKLYTLTSTAGKTVSSFFFSYSQAHITYIKRISICQGTEAPFVPYYREQMTEELGQEIYAGAYDWSAHKLTLTHKMLTLTGSENWEKGEAATVYSEEVYPDNSAGGTTAVVGVSSHIPTQPDGTLDSGYLRKSENRMLFEMDKWGLGNYEVAGWTDILKAQWAAGTPVQILYELETPVQVDIQSGAQPILGLSGINAFQSDTGDTTLTYRADPRVLLEKLCID